MIMKKMIRTAAVALVSLVAVAPSALAKQNKAVTLPMPVEAQKPVVTAMPLIDSLSVTYGKMYALSVIENIEQAKTGFDIELNKDLVYNAFCEAFKDGKFDKLALENEFLSQRNRASDEARRNSPEAVANKAAQDAYIAKLKKDKKVKFTESGLAYTVEKKGTGVKFTGEKPIDVMYVGKHLDGTEFDKSEKPVAMTPKSVITGFGEALLLMSPGAKYTFYIPAELAYGLRGAGRGVIKRNEMLIFELETPGETAEPAKEDLKPVAAPQKQEKKSEK